jgi:formylglycine-generating enzyme
MGSPTTEADRGMGEVEHQVTLNAFSISQFEITNTQYASFLNTKSIGADGMYAAGAYPDEPLIYESPGAYDWGLHYTGGEWKPVVGYENHPVIFVTWYGASEFCTYAGGVLPTEAQWEYVCRAGTSTPFNTGTCLSFEAANYRWDYPYSGCSNSNTTYPKRTQALGSYFPNAWNVYDMHGNVWEWCSDWSAPYSPVAQTNPTGPAVGSHRVIRGGSWSNSAHYCRSAFRGENDPGDANHLGFRVVLAP